MLARLLELQHRSEQLQELVLEKEAGALTAVAKAVRLAKPTLTGAAVGGIGGAIHGAMKPQEVDPVTGRAQSRAGAALSGAATGAVGGAAVGNLVGRARAPGAMQALKSNPLQTAGKAVGTALGVAGTTYGAYQTAQHLKGKYRQNQAGFDPAVQQMQQTGEQPAPGTIQ